MDVRYEIFKRARRERARLIAAATRLDLVLAEVMAVGIPSEELAKRWEAKFSDCCEEMCLRMEVIENLLGTITLIKIACEERWDDADLKHILRQFPHEKW